MTGSRTATKPLIHGGRRRRRPGAALAAVAIMLAPLAVAGAVLLAVARGDARPSVPPISVAVGAAPSAGSAGGAAPVQAVNGPPPPPGVRLSGVDAFSVPFRKPPRAGLVFDVGTGEVLWRRRPLDVLPVASLTKIMTALVVTDRARPRERVRITRAALRYSGSGIGLLPRDKRVRLEALLNGLLLVSGNDAAIALAGHVAGSERRFVRVMNERARRLGLDCTRFVSSHGLEAGNRSCARDLAVLTRLAMGRPRITRIARRSQASFRFPIKGGRLFLSGHNPLIRLGYRGAIGLKTGYTHEAGRCFVGVARRGGRTLAVILLDSANPSVNAPRLLDEGFESR
jgi:serine-type D-Ala-D-Ala carboxypeptidase (penicillin-binding protein 5/6)